MAEGQGSNNSVASNLNICIRCNKKVSKGWRCIRCGTLSHKSCLSYLKNVKFLENYTCICCSESLADDTNTVQEYDEVSPGAEYYKEKVISLKLLLAEKDSTIKYQDMTIKALNEQINLLRKIEVFFNFKIPNPPLLHTLQGASTINDSHTEDEITNKRTSFAQTNKNKPMITSEDVNRTVHLAQTKQVCRNTIQQQQQLRNDSPQQHNNNNAARSQSNVGSILVGNRTQTDGCPFKAAASQPKKHFHATNFEADVDEMELQNYLVNFAPDVTVLKINSRNPRKYSSFKISAPFQQADALLDSDIWPSDVIVNHFFPSKKLHDSSGSS